MNNTHALLLAFIEASGYEVEEEYKVYVSGVYIRTQSHEEGHKPGNQFPVHNEVDYKVTKKTGDNYHQRKSNLLVALAAEFQAGAITSTEYLAKIRNLNA